MKDLQSNLTNVDPEENLNLLTQNLREESK